MKALHASVLLMLAILLVVGCSKKMGEKEYFDLANQYMGQQNWEKAEENFEIIYKKFPNGVFNSKALFMLGYINANHLNNLEKAKKYYTEFLEKYPNHELADDAKYELDNLGKNVEEYPFMKRDEQDDEVNTAGTNSETITIQK